MTLMDMEIAGSAEEAVRRLLLGGVAASYRLASCILRDPSAAEDAVQEAALRAWSRRRELRDPERVEAWFARIVVNVCRVELERRSRGALVHLAVPIARFAAGEAADADAWAERDEVAAAVARLTPDEQIVVAMRYGRDLTVPQIADRTGLREGTVKSRLHNAARHLRAALEAERRAEERP
jgi:RNA polymerase sigma-70 factor, ECF subfamily